MILVGEGGGGDEAGDGGVGVEKMVVVVAVDLRN